MINALMLSSKVANNLIYQEQILSIREHLISRQQLFFAMQQSQMFPSIAVQLVEIGEESGSLDIMLHKIVNYYELEVDQKVSQLTTLI